jgi:hypothetical protein
LTVILGAPALLRSIIIRSWSLLDLDQIVAVADAFYRSGNKIAPFIEIVLGTQVEPQGRSEALSPRSTGR